MIFSIVAGLSEYLTTQGFPVVVTIGDAAYARNRAHCVYVDYDRDAGDDVRAPLGTKRNPNRRFANFVGFKVLVFARENRAGALAWEHDVEVYRVLDGVLVALADWAVAQGAVVEIEGGRLLKPEEIYETVEAQTLSGYQLSVRVGRSVDRKYYDGTAVSTGTVGSMVTTVRVRKSDDTYEEIT